VSRSVGASAIGAVRWRGRTTARSSLRLPPPGQVGLGHRCIARVWLTEQMGQTGEAEGHLGATWPKPQQFLHGVYLLEE